MSSKRVFPWVVSLAAITCGADLALGQSYPNRPIRIVTSQAGGGSDVAARLIAQGLSTSMGQQVLVDNRGVVAIAGQVVAKAPPDGYTLLLYASALWLTPYLRENVQYDPVKDFAPITLAVSQPSIVVAHPSLPVKSVKDLIALAKSRPGELNYASAQDGSPAHIAAELFNSMTGTRIVRITYKGSGPAFIDLIGGQVHLMFAPTGGVVPHVQAGRLRALAVTTTEPSPLFPGLPTVAATVPGYEATTPYGIFAPAGTPAPIINRLNQEIAQVLMSANVKERLLTLGVEPIGSSPSALAAKVKAEMIKWGKVIRQSGIRAE
ncbi:MAG: tripartite tricarboxylate transporter substrate binding protein [Betaproteobacteria bacterium]|nr:tripartite tricarboxylate transporter substrate binding protein [Betaproteobacteria bacterium]